MNNSKIKSIALKSLSWTYVAIILGILYVPIIWMIIWSFTGSISFSSWNGFTFENYSNLFVGNLSDEIFSALLNTLIIAVASSFIATILGTAAAIGLHSIRKKWIKTTYSNINQIPMVNSEIVTAMSMMLLFQVLRRVFGTGSNIEMFEVILAHVTFCTPYVLLNVAPRLAQSDNKIYEAALDLGCNYWQAIFKVVIPEIMPGIIVGFVMAFTLSIDDFVITEFTIDGFSTISTLIYHKAAGKKPLPSEFRALFTIIFFVVLGLLIFINKPQKEIKENKK